MKGFETAMARLSFREDEMRWVETQMKATYRGVEVPAPGTLRVVEAPIPEPGAGQVRIRVEACGEWHTDAAIVMGRCPGATLLERPGCFVSRLRKRSFK